MQVDSGPLAPPHRQHGSRCCSHRGHQQRRGLRDGLADTKPTTPAAAVFPTAARANPTIFYDGRGNARSAGDVYRTLIGRYGAARSAPANPPVNRPAAVADIAAPSAPHTGFAPDTAGLTETYAAAARLSPTVLPEDTGPMFHGLFRSTGGP